MPCSAVRSLRKSARKKFGSTTSKRARKYIWGAYADVKKGKARKRRRKR